VAIFANAIDVLRSLDVKYDSYCNEFELGRKRIFVAPEMLHNNDGSPAFDPEDTVFYKLPDDYADKDQSAGMIHEVDLQLRVEEHSRAINDDLNYLSLKCGFGQQHYKFEAGQVKTATEVISENSDMYRRLQKHEIILEQALLDLVRIIIRMGNALGAGINDNVDIDIKFDDSIIEDKQAERSSDRQDVAMGAMPLWEYRMKWYNEDEATAKSRVQMDNEDVIE
jgi:A118 family predicted phage portal protein